MGDTDLPYFTAEVVAGEIVITKNGEVVDRVPLRDGASEQEAQSAADLAMEAHHELMRQHHRAD